jgi:hypothetical protein
VTVTRGGSDIRSQLRVMQFSDGNGNSASLHGGELQFPVAAFARVRRLISEYCLPPANLSRSPCRTTSGAS